MSSAIVVDLIVGGLGTGMVFAIAVVWEGWCFGGNVNKLGDRSELGVQFVVLAAKK